MEIIGIDQVRRRGPAPNVARRIRRLIDGAWTICAWVCCGSSLSRSLSCPAVGSIECAESAATSLADELPRSVTHRLLPARCRQHTKQKLDL